MNILIAGAGKLGKNLTKLYLERGDSVRLIDYSESALKETSHPNLQTAVCDVTRPETLRGICDGIDLMISCIGITREKSNRTHQDVDLQGNVNLLREAEKAGVRKFGFISPEGVDQGWQQAPLLNAKYRFEQELKKSLVPWVIFHANGFIADLIEMGRQAAKGPLFVIGSGNSVFTPVDIGDLAEIMVQETERCSRCVLNVGGPEDLSWNDVCRICFEHYGKPVRTLRIPAAFCRLLLPLIRPFSPGGYAMGKLILFMSTTDLPGEKRGRIRLADALQKSRPQQAVIAKR